MRKIIASAAIVMAALIGSPALALETGQCLPAAQVRAALTAEGMQPIIVGTRTGYGYPTSLIFFSNADASRGYLIRGDKPLGQQSNTACVDSVYRDVRLNDITRAGIPAWARVAVKPREVEAICRGHLGYQDNCNRHDESLFNLESHGQHVMFMATGTAINPRDHSIRSGQRIVLTLKPVARGGVLMAVTPEGASYILSAYTDGGYTPVGSAMLDGTDAR